MKKEELLQLQHMELDMLKTVIALCGKHSIPYYALGGTLLGAVRHKGFIPWDDDIDIGIPRPDYEKFLEIASEELPSNLKTVYFRVQEKGTRLIYNCQVQDENVRLVQNIANIPYETNVWIDIFPLDGMPSNPVLRFIHSGTLLYRRMRIQFSMFDMNVHQKRKGRPWHERALIALHKATGIGSGSDPRRMMEKMDSALRKYDYGKSGYLINMMGAWKLKEMFPKEWYGGGVRLPFEDITINCPRQYDRVLTQMYGDYMTPVQDDREKEEHHSIEIRRTNTEK